MLAAAKAWAKGSTVQAAMDAAGQAGRLANSLHMIKQGNYPRTEPFDKEEYHKSLQIKVDVLLNLSIGKRAYKRLNRVLQTVQEFTSHFDKGVTVTYLHSDFYPDNFIVSPDGRICTVDTMLEWTGPVEKDIAEFLVFAQTPTQRLLGGAAIVRAQMLERLTQAFITGYSQRTHISSPVLILYQLLALVQRWSSLLLFERTIPALLMSGYKRIRVNPIILGHLESISNELHKEFY
jgi:thiamine kinase-like enzyme